MRYVSNIVLILLAAFGIGGFLAIEIWGWSPPKTLTDGLIFSMLGMIAGHIIVTREARS